MMFLNKNISAYSIIAHIKVMVWVLSLTLSLPAIAGDKINQSLSTDEITKIEISNDRGSIKLYAWDKLEVLVIGEIDDLADDFIFDKKGDVIFLEVELTAKHAHGKNNGKGSRLEVWLPKSLDLQFKGIATDLSISDLEGEVIINSVSGEVNAKSLSGNLWVKNISGKTVLNDISGKIEISTVSGNLDAKVESSHIKVKTISSDISVVTNQIDSISLFSISGKTKLSGSLNENGNIDLENISGESIFYYSDPINAEVSIETGPDGSIVNQLKSFERKESHLNSQQQYFVEGSGNAKIMMHTVNGKIGLKKLSEMNKSNKR